METLRVLVVDDEPGMRLGVRRVLNDYQVDVPDIDAGARFEVQEADCGESALEQLAKTPPDLVILDHKMPGMSGLDVLDVLRESHPSILTIMITAYASIETAVRAVKRGAYDFLAKPFTPDELRNTVKKAAIRLVLARQARRLADERNAVRMQLMRTLSHELQAPLNATDGYLDLIRNRACGDDLSAYDELLDRSQERIAGMRRLICDLLQMTTLESHTRTRTLTSVDLTAIARDAVETFETQADKMRLTVTLHRDQPLLMQGVADELQMLLQNLISNAVKYNRPGGEVHVTVDQYDNTVSIGVADTGWGIPSGELDRLFDEFVRIHDPNTRHVPGTGLGLAIVKRIARLYGGDVVVDSEPGIGSKFTVLLKMPTPLIDTNRVALFATPCASEVG